jgi:hypothetical protein
MKLLLNTLNKTQHSGRLGDNRLDMRQKLHSAVHNHSTVFDCISPLESRPIN